MNLDFASVLFSFAAGLVAVPAFLAHIVCNNTWKEPAFRVALFLDLIVVILLLISAWV